MIRPDIFSSEFAMLEEWFQASLSDPIKLRYQQLLSASLSDAEFRAACLKCMSEMSPHSSFPSIQKIIEYVRISPQETALLEWENIVQFCAVRRTERIMPLRLSEAGERALSLIGGVDAIGESNLTQMSFLRRDFLQYRASLARIESRRAYTARALNTAKATVQHFNWDEHPEKQNWIDTIKRLGVPEFINQSNSSEDRNARMEFYRHANRNGWLSDAA